MSARVTWIGLKELREALRNLPQELTEEATDIVDNTAEVTRSQIQVAYPRRTGNLRDHLVVDTKASGPFGVIRVLKNTSRHAHLFELGTVTRQTALGADRGAMPAGKIFVPRVVKARRAMYETLKKMLVKHGLIVSGDA